MVSPYNFIISPKGGRRYNNINNEGLITSSSQEDHTVTNRFGIVENVPMGYTGDIKLGDTLLVHHNVFRKYYDMKGRERSGPCHVKDDIYVVYYDQFFLYQSNGKWKAPNPYCFIRPLENKEISFGNINEEEMNELFLIGEIAYINNQLLSLGLKVGDKISFTPDSEYAFEVEGEKLYRMFTRNICLKL